MTTRHNEHGQPIGPPLPDWQPPPRPARRTLEGRYCRIEPLDAVRHADALYAANMTDPSQKNFTYLFSGPFDSLASYRNWLATAQGSEDPLYFAIVDAQRGSATGIASYLRIDPANGVIEVGNINYSPLLQRTRAATEAMYLLMSYAFELGYRRYEWKCDALNAPSRAAALRLGFQYEGIFRQAVVYKGRSRDTAWYAVTDGDWPALARAYAQWLAPENFDADGQQRIALSALTARA